MDMVITMVGADQPGLVSELTRILYEQDANLGDADMTRVGGTFAFILTVSLPEDRIHPLSKKLEEFSDQKDVEIHTTDAEHFRSRWGNVEPDTIVSVYGADKPGIVYRVSETLAENGINICDLQSSLDKDQDVYIMAMEIHRPDGFSLEELESQLHSVAEDLNVDVSVRDISDAPL
ncbi:MAG: glycine cleavage system protein R [bacterium]